MASLPCPDGLDAVAWAALPDEMRHELFTAHLNDQQHNTVPPAYSATLANHTNARWPLTTCHGTAIPQNVSIRPSKSIGASEDDNTSYCSVVTQGMWVSSIDLDQEISQCRKLFGIGAASTAEPSSSNNISSANNNNSSDISSTSDSAASNLFVDTSFPAAACSIDGFKNTTTKAITKDNDADDDNDAAAEVNDRELEKDVPMCKCGRLARLRTVGKQGKSQGRRFWGCTNWGKKANSDNNNNSSSSSASTPATQSCSFFIWATKIAHSKRDLSYIWMRPRPPPFYPPVVRHVQRSIISNTTNSSSSSSDRIRTSTLVPLFKASDVRQGRVGDCWFLAALSTVAEQSDLVAKLVETTERSSTGSYVFRLFHKGQWVKVHVSDELPYVPKKQSKNTGALTNNSKLISKNEEGERNSLNMQGESCELAFSKGAQGLLWVPLLEKAYAKLHGSYQAISGGWVAEALFDLTGFPTETVLLSADSEGGVVDRGQLDLVWAHLLSFVEHGFPMGAACYAPDKSKGLVGGHAYSVLDARVTHNVKVGRQSTMHELFNGKSKSVSVVTKQQEHQGEGSGGVHRFVRLRNPWGRSRVEWKGAFAKGSAEWSDDLRSALGEGSCSNSNQCKKKKEDDQENDTFWLPFEDFAKQFYQLDVCKARMDWQVLSVNTRLRPKVWWPDQMLLVKSSESTQASVSVAQATKRGDTSAYYFEDLCVCVVQLPNIGQQEDEIASGVAQQMQLGTVTLLTLNGQCKTSHHDVMLPAGTCLLMCFSVGRCGSGPSKVKQNHHKFTPCGNSANRTRQQHTQRAALFTIRVLTAKSVSARTVAGSSALASNILRHCITSRLQRTPECTNTVVRVRDVGEYGRLAVIQSRAAAIAVAINTHPSKSLFVSFMLHGPGVGASNMLSDGSVPEHLVPCMALQVVACVASIPLQDYEIGLSDSDELGTGLFGSFEVDNLRMVGMNTDGSIDNGSIDHSQSKTVGNDLFTYRNGYSTGVDESVSATLVLNAMKGWKRSVASKEREVVEVLSHPQTRQQNRSRGDIVVIDDDDDDDDDVVACVDAGDANIEKDLISGVEGPSLEHEVTERRRKRQLLVRAATARSSEGMGISTVKVDEQQQQQQQQHGEEQQQANRESEANQRILDDTMTDDESDSGNDDDHNEGLKSRKRPGPGSPTPQSSPKISRAGTSTQSNISAARDMDIHVLQNRRNDVLVADNDDDDDYISSDDTRSSQQGNDMNVLVDESGAYLNLLPISCVICMCDADVGTGVVLRNCKHSFCRECITTFVQTQLCDAGQTLNEISCPHLECHTRGVSDSGNGSVGHSHASSMPGPEKYTRTSRSMSMLDLRALLGTQAFAKAEGQALSRLVDVDPTLFRCVATPGCDFVASWGGPDDGPPKLMCFRCHAESCLACGTSPFHNDRTCEEARTERRARRVSLVGDGHNESDDDDDEVIANYLAKSNIRICAQCKNGVLKSEGCDKFRCRCGYQWCWKCGAKDALCRCTGAVHGFYDNAPEVTAAANGDEHTMEVYMRRTQQNNARAARARRKS